MARTLDDTLRDVTTDYLDNLDMDNLPSPNDIKGDILEQCEHIIDLVNATKDKNKRWLIPKQLCPAQIGDIILHTYRVRNISYVDNTDENTYTVLGIYQEDGPSQGIYSTNESEFAKLIQAYNYSITTHDINETIEYLQRYASCEERNKNQDLIAVNNGIFDYKIKQLMPFNSDYVFTAKCKVDYKLTVANTPIHNATDNTDWDIETWMNELHDDAEVVQVLWEILGAIIRPNVAWEKSAWFYSNTGNNGKGTLCELMRNLCGKNSYTSIPLSDFSKDFALEPLIRASAIIVDENDVGTYIDKAANLKAVITNDAIQINRKYKMPITYKFKGFMIQCLNEYPRIKDKSDSFYRRQLFVPFDKCFTGKERKYIKSDYLNRTNVLEYVLHKVMNTDYYKLSEPEACKNVLDDYKHSNDPLRQFFDDIIPRCAWSFIPYVFLYEIYKVWYPQSIGGKDILSQKTFATNLKNLADSSDDYAPANNGKSIPTPSCIKAPEPLILEFGLDYPWLNKIYQGNDPMIKCTPVDAGLKTSYQGIKKL